MALFIGLTLYAWTSKINFTYMGGLIWAGIIMLIASLFLLFFYPSRYVIIGVSVIVILLVCVFIIFDTKMIADGEKHSELTYDDYIVASLILYTDIITLFLWIL